MINNGGCCDMNEIHFSVITPVFNNSKTIMNAINSVRNQNMEDYEHIIIDDGSTDDTPELLDREALKDEKLIVIHQENQWIYASYNNAIKVARGKYIFVLNSDDTLRGGTFNIVKKIIDKYNPDVIYTQLVIHKCDSNQKIIEEDTHGYSRMVLEDCYLDNKYEHRKKWLELLEKRYLSSNINFYKREISLAHPYKNDNFVAERFFNIEIADEINTAYILGSHIVYNHFLYENENNASLKYYPNSHEVFNGLFVATEELLRKWNMNSIENMKIIAKERFVALTFEFKLLMARNCPLNTGEKLKHIINIDVDEVVERCNDILQDGEALEARVLSAARELLVKEEIDKHDDMYFVYELLDSLLRYEKDDIDKSKIKSGVYNINNPHNIGKVFYEKLYKRG